MTFDSSRASVAEPAAAAAFVRAYARGDEAAAERAASPLYAAEWARRGASAQRREACLHPATSTTEGWLRFTYQAGMVDQGGFRHLLYTAEPVAGPPIPTVWRIDTSPDGRVIWSEPVWLFERSVALVRVRVLPDAEDLADAAGLPAAASARVAGMRASDAAEGYYAVGVEADASAGPKLSRPTFVHFFAVDDGGSARPGAWSYGEPRPGLIEYGKQRDPLPIQLPADQRALRDAYVADL